MNFFLNKKKTPNKDTALLFSNLDSTIYTFTINLKLQNVERIKTIYGRLLYCRNIFQMLIYIHNNIQELS